MTYATMGKLDTFSYITTRLKTLKKCDVGILLTGLHNTEKSYSVVTGEKRNETSSMMTTQQSLPAAGCVVLSHCLLF